MIALIVGWAVWKNRKANPLWLMLIASTGMATFNVLYWLCRLLFAKLEWWTLYEWAGSTISFIMWILTFAFAAGFCWERLAKKTAEPAGFPVTATPVETK
jgi:hypothetical protein